MRGLLIRSTMFDAHTSPLQIDYRPRNRHTYIRLSPAGEIIVRTPLKNETTIRRIVKLREGWIREKLSELRSCSDHHPVLGKEIRFRGENRLIEQLPRLHQKITQSTERSQMEKHYYRFYKEEAVLTLPSRVAHYARKMDLHPKEIRFKRLRSRWGSCDSNGTVTFNIMMMQLTYEQIDYIIVHELAHLRHMNHSKAFHDLVKSYLPQSTKLRSELKKIHPIL